MTESGEGLQCPQWVESSHSVLWSGPACVAASAYNVGVSQELSLILACVEAAALAGLAVSLSLSLSL